MINENTSLSELAFILSDHLQRNGIDAILVGGGVVSIYTNNDYESYDLDFISPNGIDELDQIMKKIGFTRKARCFFHKKSNYFVEFPGTSVFIGDEHQQTFATLKKGDKTLKLLTPTQSIMDRLAAFYHWGDRSSLDQAVLIAKSQNYSISRVKRWSMKERQSEKFKIFLSKLKMSNSN